MLGIQLVTRVETLHSKGLSHGNIQPGHVIIDGETNVAYLIGFEISGCSPSGKRRTLYKQAEYLTSKVEQSLVDDMISLGYVLYRLLVGHLPWKDMHEDRTVLANQAFPEKLLDHRELGEYFRHLHALQLNELPNYQYLRNIFAHQLNEAGLVDDNHYDWNADQDQDQDREFCRRQAKQIYERIADLGVQITQIKGQDREDQLPKTLRVFLKASRYVLKIQLPSYISLGLLKDENHLLVIASIIATFKAYCISKMGAPEIPTELINRAYSDVCAYSQLWPEFNWKEQLKDLVEFMRRRMESEKAPRVHFHKLEI
jgi:serine/threonine protein kinase